MEVDKKLDRVQTTSPKKQAMSPKKKPPGDETQFTLALLDKYQLSDFHETLSDDGEDVPFTYVKPYLRQSIRHCNNISIITGPTNQTEPRKYYVVTYETKRATSSAERITNLFTDTPNKKFVGLSYSAAIILPVENFPNLALVYLLGKWNSLINRESIVINFGVRTVASSGISPVGEEGGPNNIKEVGSNSTKGANSTKNWSKNRTALGKLSAMKLDMHSVVTEIRLRPIQGTFGNKKLIKGKDWILFNFRLPQENEEKDKYADSLRDVAFRLYNDYFLTYEIAKEFAMYFDSPVVCPEISEKLIKELDDNWAVYMRRDKITIHEVFWSMLLNGREKDRDDLWETQEIIKQGKSGTVVKIGRDTTKISNVITVQCICVEDLNQIKKFYRMERGIWYEMDESKITLIKANIISEDIISSDDLSLMKATDDHDEGSYNQEAVTEINSKHYEKFSAVLLDKQLVRTGKRESFELADLSLIKKTNVRSQSHTYLIHVKRANMRKGGKLVNQLDHHCNQVKRAAYYMALNLDRSAASKCFAKCFTDQLYIKLINKPKLKERFYTFQKKYANTKLISNRDKFVETLEAHIGTKGSKMVEQVMEIKEVLNNWEEWKVLYDEISKYGDALYRWLDCMVDYAASPINPDTTQAARVDVMKDSLELMLERLRENKIFTKSTDGILSQKQKNKITFVLAIITKRQPEEYLIENKIILVDDVITSVKAFGFKCKLTFIPVVDEVGPTTVGDEGNWEKTGKRTKQTAKKIGKGGCQNRSKRSTTSIVKENTVSEALVVEPVDLQQGPSSQHILSNVDDDVSSVRNQRKRAARSETAASPPKRARKRKENKPNVLKSTQRSLHDMNYFEKM